MVKTTTASKARSKNASKSPVKARVTKNPQDKKPSTKTKTPSRKQKTIVKAKNVNHHKDFLSEYNSYSSQSYSSDSSSSQDFSESETPRQTPTQTKKKMKNGILEGHDPNNPVRVYADGVFDMFHIGHAKVLEQAKKLFPYVHLVVGVSGDKETIEKKGKIVMNQDERVEIIKHCKWVDEVICPCPWVLDVSFLKKNNIDYVAHDDLPYGSVGQKDIYAEIKEAGMFKATQRTEGISTSDIILRIIRDYDLYVQRSLERGATRREIGVSQSKLLRIKMKKAFKGFVSGFDKKGELNITPSALREQMHHFFEQQIDVQKKFANKFKNSRTLNRVNKAVEGFFGYLGKNKK